MKNRAKSAIRSKEKPHGINFMRTYETHGRNFVILNIVDVHLLIQLKAKEYKQEFDRWLNDKEKFVLANVVLANFGIRTKEK